jgi:hypothetical protein
MLKKQWRDVVEEARDGVYHSFSARAVRRNCKQFTAIVVAGTLCPGQTVVRARSHWHSTETAIGSHEITERVLKLRNSAFYWGILVCCGLLFYAGGVHDHALATIGAPSPRTMALAASSSPTQKLLG